jgi:Tfp pilus assembly protein PilV
MLNVRRGFSLIEVLFAVTFLMMVGVAMSSLNSAAARLVTAGETKLSAYALNEQTLAYLTILRKSQAANFSVAPCTVGQTCYVSCPASPLATNCSLSTEPKAVQLGRSRLQYVPEVRITQSGTSFLLLAKTSWGKGANRSVISSQLVE